ncbi:MAG TPA: DUF2752 domain-containing protein [Candidatus Saccharimonadales bacterium]|nr:DUF2752 domain-containing protein [Candidatus Saccharimonadales bacterium]
MKIKQTNKIKSLMSLISLTTPGSRLIVWAVLTMAIWIAPFNYLRHLSLYEHLGWHSAPSIGLTRAYWYVLHGQFSNAWNMNHLIYVILAVGIPLLVFDVYKLTSKINKN